MIKSLEKMFYPLAIFMVLVVFFAVANEILYLLLFIPVLFFLGLFRIYILDQRLHYYGEEALATVVKYQSYVNFDEDVASSRRGSVKREVLIMEFITMDNELVRGQPTQYDLNGPELDEDENGLPSAAQYNEYKNFNPVGQKYEIIYDRERPTTFIFKELLIDEIGLSAKLMQGLGIFIILSFVYIFYTYSVVGTILQLF